MDFVESGNQFVRVLQLNTLASTTGEPEKGGKIGDRIELNLPKWQIFKVWNLTGNF